MKSKGEKISYKTIFFIEFQKNNATIIEWKVINTLRRLLQEKDGKN